MTDPNYEDRVDASAAPVVVPGLLSVAGRQIYLVRVEEWEIVSLDPVSWADSGWRGWRYAVLEHKPLGWEWRLLASDSEISG